MSGYQQSPTTALSKRRQTRPAGPRLVGGLLVFAVGMIVSFLAGSGTAAIYSRLFHPAAEIVDSSIGGSPGNPGTSHDDDSGMVLAEHDGVLKATIDPQAVRLDLAKGWDREQLAFQDSRAMLYFTGPFFEEEGGTGYEARIIGDIWFNGQLTEASPASKPFANRRFYLALTSRHVIFGYGGWEDRFRNKYRMFVGGLGYLFASDPAPQDYSDPYSGLKQRLHDAIPRERLIVGKDNDGRLIVMKTPPRTTTAAADTARAEGLSEAYYLDQGNKARFIAPGKVDDRPRFNLPYMLRVADRNQIWDETSSLSSASANADGPRPRRRRHRRRNADASQVANPSQPQAQPADSGGWTN